MATKRSSKATSETVTPARKPKASAAKKAAPKKAAAKKAAPKRTAAKKAAPKKAGAKKAAPKRAVAKKAAPTNVSPRTSVATETPVTKKRLASKKVSVPSGQTLGSVVSVQERQALIAEAAYLRAESRGFAAGGELEDWIAAERQIDAQQHAR